MAELQIGGQYQIRPFLGGPHGRYLLDGVVVEPEGTWAGAVRDDGAGQYVEVFFDGDDAKYAPPEDWDRQVVRAIGQPDDAALRAFYEAELAADAAAFPPQPAGAVSDAALRAMLDEEVNLDAWYAWMGAQG